MDAQWNKRHIGSGIPKKQFSRKWTRARRSLRSIASFRKLSTEILSGENRAVAKNSTLNISEWSCISHLYMQGVIYSVLRCSRVLCPSESTVPGQRLRRRRWLTPTVDNRLLSHALLFL